MVRFVALSIGTAALAIGLGGVANGAAPKAGAACGKSVKAGRTVTRGPVTLRCVKTRKGKVWRRVATPAPAPTPTPTPATGPAAGVIPSRTWQCSTGAYPYVSYSRLITAGTAYTVSLTDGTGANTGAYSQGSTAPLDGGTPIKWEGGTWGTFKGEYTPAGTVDPDTGKASQTDRVLVGTMENTYYPTVCTPA